MDNLDKMIVIDKYVDSLAHEYNQMSLMRKFLIIDDQELSHMIDVSLKIIKNRIKNLKKCKTIEECDQYINVKKILKKYLILLREHQNTFCKSL